MNGKGQPPAPRLTQGKGVPPPPPPFTPKSQGGQSFHAGPDGKKEDWKERLERLAEEAKPQHKIKLTPPLESDWVQCCHGGIEPRFDPRPLLQSHKRFCVTGVGPDYDRGREFEGLNWSDFTGIDHKSQDRFSSKDPRGGHSGFECDIPDVRFYSENVGIKAFFRGHQDTLCCFKLVVRHQEGVVPWPKLLARPGNGCACSVSSLRQDGVFMSRFLEDPDTVPVFTFSSCVEARALPDEGFGIVTVDQSLARWKLRAFVYPVERVERSVQEWVDQQWVAARLAGWGIAKSLFLSRSNYSPTSNGMSTEEAIADLQRSLSIDSNFVMRNRMCSS